MPSDRSSHELRCFCNREPLLATYGIDKKGQLYVHVRVYKQRRIFGEMVVVGGSVQLKCRECHRWHKVTMRQPNRAELSETRDAPVLPNA